ncbi:MAG: acetate--CoA ligase family protein [Deltaproteobacteria bacterium]|nr:acetate--CoA ligase family protein [Deltaproteobacteria bacterium]
MLSREDLQILEKSKEWGWVLEPDAKRLFARAGLDVPNFRLACTEADAVTFAGELGYPLVAKIVSPKVLHKSDVGGVVVGIDNDAQIKSVFSRFSQFDQFVGIHLEEMAAGVELIVGAKIDPQFGPVVLLGMGGIGVEIYQDIAIRMAPISKQDVMDMVSSLKARKLLEGYRGSEPVNLKKLAQALVAFSELVMEMAGEIESIDLNPVMCTADRCIIADARIMMKPPSMTAVEQAP